MSRCEYPSSGGVFVATTSVLHLLADGLVRGFHYEAANDAEVGFRRFLLSVFDLLQGQGLRRDVHFQHR